MLVALKTRESFYFLKQFTCLGWLLVIEYTLLGLGEGGGGGGGARGRGDGLPSSSV